MKPDRGLSIFLDTTFLLPFLQIDIGVEGFTLHKFKDLYMMISRVHFSELSVFEAKAKIYRLSRRDSVYVQALEAFGENLAVLREDEKFIFHPYTAQDDKYFNMISAKNLELNTIDMIIIAQAIKIGTLVTEDKDILSVREKDEFAKDPVLGKINIKRWKELTI